MDTSLFCAEIGAQLGVSVRRRLSRNTGKYDQPSYADGGRP